MAEVKTDEYRFNVNEDETIALMEEAGFNRELTFVLGTGQLVCQLPRDRWAMVALARLRGVEF